MEEKMPLHIVEKKIPYLDENGEPVKPETPNGYKFESLVLDMIHQMDSCLPFEVVRSRIKPVWILWRVQENCSLRMALCCKHFDSFSQHKVIEETTELQ